MKGFIGPTIAAIFVILVVILFGSLYYYIFSHMPLSLFWQIGIIAIGLGVITTIIVLLVKRFKEIKEEDHDLSQY